MSNNHPTDDEKTGGNRNLFLQKETENSMYRASMNQTNIKQITTKRTLQLNFLGHIIRRKGLEHFTVTGHIDGKRD